MCGYCIESAVICDLLEALKSNVFRGHDTLFYPVHLQEASDWRAELISWDSDDHPRGALVALCRQWSERLAGNGPPPLKDVLATETMADLQRWLMTLDYPPEWGWALRADGSPPNPLPIELARAKLDSYITNWIQPSHSDALTWDYKTLNEFFLSVSIAFDIVAKCAPDDARLEVLATHAPSMTPFFDGLDLWLQRRATQACVSRLGPGFIKEHLGEIRIEAIISVVLSDLLTSDDLMELQSSLHGRSHHSFNLGPDDLLGPLQTKIHRLPANS